MTSSQERIPASHAHRAYWHRDVEKLLAFIVPVNANVRYVDDAHVTSGAGAYDYVVIRDTMDFGTGISATFAHARQGLAPDGRLVLVYRSALWKPIVRGIEMLRMRKKAGTWLSEREVRTLLHENGFEIVRTGRRLLLPLRIPIVSAAFNMLGQLPLINRLCFVRYSVARSVPQGHREYSVSVVVPARNEKGNIRSIVERMPQFGKTLEIIFVEGNSSDGTWEEAQRVAAAHTGPIQVRAVQQDGKGKKDAVYKGFAMAEGEILIILDADVTVAPEDLPQFYEAIASGSADFVNGSRLTYAMESGAMPLINRLGNSGFALIYSWMYGKRFRDTLCGTKALRKADWEAIRTDATFGEYDSFGDFDLLLGALKRNLVVADMPIRYRRRVYGEPNILRFSHGWALLKMCMAAAVKIKG